MKTFRLSVIITAFTGIISCQNISSVPDSDPIFSTSFESVDEFKKFYIVPQNYKNTAPSVSNGVLYNDDLTIRSVERE
jgi:hypothetical protein